MRRILENLGFSIVISLTMMGAARWLFPPPAPACDYSGLEQRLDGQRQELAALNKLAAEVKTKAEHVPQAVQPGLNVIQAMEMIEEARTAENKAKRDLILAQRRVYDTRQKFEEWNRANTDSSNPEPYHNCTNEVIEVLNHL